MTRVLEIRDLWKRFRIPHERRTTILDHLAGATSVLGGTRYKYEEFWALRQLNLTLDQNQSLGIIGPNGSGKSTLLKLIANIMKPEKGEVLTYGTLVPVLELGIGFHRDLTVKENAIVYGVLMGIARSEMRKRIGPILDFSGLTRFEDALLKNLSSGMQVRLAFSIAVETNADVFLIDEALAVGDEAFKVKCLERFREFKRQNKSIVLVSHDMELVNTFCENALYLKNGETKAYGPSSEITRQYIEASRSSGNANL
jgi:lipopolysaccharide transport system ATP-binding protein